MSTSKTSSGKIILFRATRQEADTLAAEAQRRSATSPKLITITQLLREALYDQPYFKSSLDKSVSGSAGSNARPSSPTAKVSAISIVSPQKSTTRKHSSH